MNTLLILQLIGLLTMTLVSVGYRTQHLPFNAFAGILALSFLLVFIVSFYSAIKYSVVLWQHSGQGGANLSIPWFSFILVFAFALWLGAFIKNVASYPRIHDITTDLNNPPQFTHVKTLRKKSDNSLLSGPAVSALQKKHYPQLKALESGAGYEQTFERAHNVATAMGWQIVFSDQKAGFIEASDRSLVFGFVDDVVIRIVLDESFVRIDLRSASRVGQSDLGVNARRIEAFFTLYRQMFPR